MKSLTDFLQTGSNTRIYESADDVQKVIKQGQPFILTGGYRETHKAVCDAALGNNYMIYTVFVDKMTSADLEVITIDGQKILPSWAAHVADNDNKCLLVFLFDKEKDHSDLFNALMPIFLENKLFGKKYSHFIPCIVTTKDLELPQKLAKKLTSITV